MNTRGLKTTLLLLIALPLLLSSTAYSQTTSTKGDSVCFEKQDAILIFQDLQLYQVCKQIKESQKEQIIQYEELVAKMEEERKMRIEDNAKLSKSLSISNTKLKISRKLTFYGVPAALIGGFLIGKL